MANVRPAESLLHVPIVALAFRSGPEVVETFQTALALDPDARCWAIASATEVPMLRANWLAGDLEGPLLLLHSPPEEAPELAIELINSISGPVAVLVANLPIVRGMAARFQRVTDLVRRLERAHNEVQVHVHHRDWSRRPPRIR